MHSLQWSWILFFVAALLGFVGGEAGIIALVIMVIGLALYIKGLIGVIKHGIAGIRFHFIFATILYALVVLSVIISFLSEFIFS